MKNLYKYSCNIYPQYLWVAIGKEGISDFEEDIEEMETDTCGETIVVDNGSESGVLIRFENVEYMTEMNITHESVHAAIYIFDYINADVDVEHQEPFAYLAGWVAQCCRDAKNKKLKE